MKTYKVTCNDANNTVLLTNDLKGINCKRFMNRNSVVEVLSTGAQTEQTEQTEQTVMTENELKAIKAVKASLNKQNDLNEVDGLTATFMEYTVLFYDTNLNNGRIYNNETDESTVFFL